MPFWRSSPIKEVRFDQIGCKHMMLACVSITNLWYAEPGNGSAELYERQISQNGASTSDRGLLLELEDVKFGYDPKRPVLKGINLKVERGKVKPWLDTLRDRYLIVHQDCFFRLAMF